MGKTVTIPNSRPPFTDPQEDCVRTGCCLFVKFAAKGTLQLRLMSGSTAIPTFPFHVKKKEYGPFKTPILDTIIGWRFDPDNGMTGADGILKIDGNGNCKEIKPSHTFEGDRAAKPKRGTQK